MQKFIIVLFFVLILILNSCEKNTTAIEDKPQGTLRALTSSEQVLVESDQKFSLDLFKTISAGQTDSNVFVSPLSVSMALGMALNGANGQTYIDMQNTMALSGLSEEQINKAYKSLIELLTSVDEKVIFEIANSMWPKEGYPIQSAFIETNQNYFDAEIQALDFNASESVDIINNWVAEKTHDKIKEILDVIPPDAVLYLINAIYFKATWLYEFDKDLTNEQNFYTQSGNTVTTDMMYTTADLNYYDDDEVQIVELPYGNGNYTMTVFLPAQTTDMETFIQSLDETKWESYLSGLEEKNGTVEFPKLKMEYKNLLNDELKNMGMEIAFGPSADFSRINGYGGIFISRVIHKTFVQIDEEGTEAAAVTLIEFRETSSGNDPTLDFYVKLNRPFFFVIREQETNSIAFMGKIMQPVWE